MHKLKIVLDQRLSPGQKMAQAVHVAQTFGQKFRRIEQKWMKSSNTIVILQVEDENHLKELLVKAQESKIRCLGFYEPDWQNQLTAICLEPGDKTNALTKELGLAK
jgi:hypothetical protein